MYPEQWLTLLLSFAMSSDQVFVLQLNFAKRRKHCSKKLLPHRGMGHRKCSKVSRTKIKNEVNRTCTEDREVIVNGPTGSHAK